MTVVARIEVDVSKLTKALSRSIGMEVPLKKFLTKAAITVEGRAKLKSPVDTGRLRSSITHKIEKERALVGSNVFYAPYVEFGTRPHFPPVGALATWARRHGFASPWPLAVAISRRGTRPHPYLGPALEESRGDVDRFLKEMGEEVVKLG